MYVCFFAGDDVLQVKKDAQSFQMCLIFHWNLSFHVCFIFILTLH